MTVSGFLLEVWDSAQQTNPSGAQTGALDPLNDMFFGHGIQGMWMEKMEGDVLLKAMRLTNKVEYLYRGVIRGENSVMYII
jgi:hypothetical protein